MKKIALAGLLCLFFSHAGAQTPPGGFGPGPVPSPVTAIPVPISQGGTGATAAQAALQNLTGLPVVYAANFGVKANGQTAIDAGCTSGSANITSASLTAANQTSPPQAIVVYCGASTATTMTTVSGSRVITIPSVTTTGVQKYQEVTGAGIPAGSYVVAASNTTNQVFLNNYATAAGSAVAVAFVVPINTTITSAATGTATLATTMSTTTSGMLAYFGTDDTIALQNTVSACGNTANYPNGGVIQLAAGMSMITNVINTGNYPSNCSLLGQSRSASEFFWASPVTMSPTLPAVVLDTNTSYAASLHDVVFAHFWINMQAAISNPYSWQASCLRIPFNRNVTITDMRFTGSPATCVGADYPQRLLVDGNIFDGDARLGLSGGGSVAVLLGESATNPENLTVTNNQFYNTGTWAVMAENTTMGTGNQPTVPQDSGIISANYIYYDAYSVNNTIAFAIQDAGFWGAQITSNVIIAPTVTAANFVGIGVGCGDLGCGTAGTGGEHGNIADNTVIGSGTSYYFDGVGINDYTLDNDIGESSGHNTTGGFTINPNGGTDTGIFLKNDTAWESDGSGFSTVGSGTLKNITMSGDKSINSLVGDGFFFGLGVTNLTMTADEAYDDGPGTQQYALGVGTGIAITGANIQHNNWHGNTHSAYNLVGTITGLVEDNGVQPVFTVTGAGTPVGLGEFGTFTSTATGAMTAVVTPSGTGTSILAPHGWVCPSATDLTTPADTVKFTSSTQSTATFTGTVVSGDVIAFSCQPY